MCLVGTACLRRSFSPAGGLKTYGSYQELAEDPDVDVVYVNAIHTTHKDMTVLMLQHGKHVLSEKPIAVRTGSACILPGFIPGHTGQSCGHSHLSPC